MNKDNLDRTLTATFDKDFRLSQADEDALWSQFTVCQARETEAWAGFARVMLMMSQMLQPALKCSAWPGRYKIRV